MNSANNLWGGAGGFLPTGSVLGTDFLDVAFFVSRVSVLICLAVFKGHRFVTDGTGGLPTRGVARNAIQGIHKWDFLRP